MAPPGSGWCRQQASTFRRWLLTTRTNVDRLSGPGQVVSVCGVDAIPRTATGKLRIP